MRKVYGWSVLSVLLCGSVVLAQQPRPGVPAVRPGTQPSVQPGTQPVQPGVRAPGQNLQQNQVQNQVQQQHQHADQQIAAMIAGCNRNEVEIAKFAMSKLQSDEAKEVATMMIKDHTEAANKFSKWAGQPSNVNTRSTDGAREESRRDNEQSRAVPATAPNATAPNATAPNNAAAAAPRVALKPATGGLDWMAVHQEIATEGLASCKKELSRYEGNEFDKAFLGHQIGAHMMAATNLKVLKRHASSELASEIDSALETTESHLKKIRDLMDEKKDEKSDK